jgi:LacI family transcriptional regulator
MGLKVCYIMVVIVNGNDNRPSLVFVRSTMLSSCDSSTTFHPRAHMARNKKVTIKQVAKEAGVSTQTVSRVINQRPDVAPETRRRVQRVIDRLGYHPSYIARSLIQGRSCTLGVVGYGLDYYGPSRTLSGIEKQANDLGFTLLLSLMRHPEPDDHTAERLLREMLARQVDGIIWAVPDIGNNRDLIEKEVPRLPIPVVFLTMEPRHNLSTVAIDNHSGGRMATEHLLAQGYQNVGHVTGPLDWWEARQRRSGWQEALERAGRRIEEELVVKGDWGAESGMQGLCRLLEQHPDVDAVFFGNDQMALGGLRAARQMGRRVPDDLAVVGFDDIPESAYFHPPLSTMKQQIFDLGCYAVRELNRMIEASGQGDADARPKSILLQPELIVRDSSMVR